MNLRPLPVSLLFFLLSLAVAAQNNGRTFQAVGVRSYSGELRLRAMYRTQEQSWDQYFEKQESFYYSGGILANANLFLIHPNFCELDLGAGFMPESNRDNYLAAPDFSEVRTVRKLNATAAFFRQKKLSFSASGNYDESYSKREQMTDIKTTSKYLGASMVFSNKYLPLTVDFSKRRMDQLEIQTGRRLNLDQTHLEARAEQSFSTYDHQKLVYSHRIAKTLNENGFKTDNTADEFNFTSNLAIGKKKVVTFNTLLDNIRQYGYYAFDRLNLAEDMQARLPQNFTFRTHYQYYNTLMPFGRTIQHNFGTYLQHHLYKSLSTRLYNEFSSIRHAAYAENNNKTGIDLNYTKKLPFGVLNLTYGFFYYNLHYHADSSSMNVSGEEYVLSDSKIVLLKRPNVLPSSVIVRDVTGTILYQQGIDYILVPVGNFLEIRRVPSGMIPNEGTVFLDYTASQATSYSYGSKNNMVSANIGLLKGKLDVYYRLAIQDYSNLDNTDLVALNYFTQNVVGFRIGFDHVTGGAEYEDYKSTIIPYRMFRVFLGVQKTLWDKLVLVLNGNMQNYTMLNEPTARIQRYADLSGRIEYAFARQSKVTCDLTYRKQTGRDIDLDLVTGRFEISSVIYKLYLTGGIEFYRRNYVGERINFKGTYFQIARKF